jgi:hypothetical protein
MPSPELGAGPTPETSPFGPSNPLPSDTPSPELGAGPGLTAPLAAALTAPTQSIAIVNIATIEITLINFFISITTYNGASAHSNLRNTLEQAFQDLEH